MKFDGFIIVSDIDGTFLSDDKKFVKRNLDAIEYFKNNGGIFTFATGRTEELVRICINDIISLANAPMILCNGAYIYDFEKKEKYYELTMHRGKTKELFEFVDKEFPQVAFRTPWEKGLITKAPMHRMIAKEFGNVPEAITMVDCVDKIPTEKIFKAVFACDEPEIFMKLEKDIREKFGEYFSFITSEANFFEVLPKGSSKGTILPKLKEFFYNKNSTVFAIGDYHNDIEMLRCADVSACPSNALDTVKQVCRYTLCSNNDGAIADLIEKIEQNYITI